MVRRAGRESNRVAAVVRPLRCPGRPAGRRTGWWRWSHSIIRRAVNKKLPSPSSESPDAQLPEEGWDGSRNDGVDTKSDSQSSEPVPHDRRKEEDGNPSSGSTAMEGSEWAPGDPEDGGRKRRPASSMAAPGRLPDEACPGAGQASAFHRRW